MMVWQRGYKFSPEEIARHRCLDCGVNVIEIGDYCMVQSEIWRDQFGLGWDDNLCIACIEKRLGRRLTPVCTENLIRVDDVMESPKLAE